MPPPQVSLPVVGAAYPNKDGSNRQFEIMVCEPGEPIDLRPEPTNEFDEHAVAVFTERGTQIGYIEAERAIYLGVLRRAGHELRAIFQQETSWGAVVRIGIDEDPLLPPVEVETQHKSSADPDSGFYPDWIPPDD